MKIRNLFLLITFFGCESWIYYKHTIINESDYDLPIMFKSSTYSFGDPDRIRTYDLLLRRQLLYPAELRDHF